MTNYKNGKIYKITSQGKIYIGSTTQSLSQRLGGHKKDNKSITSLYHFVYNTDCQITLIELYPCNSREELLMRERYHIDQNPNCINKCKKPLLSEEERINSIKQQKHDKCIRDKIDKINRLENEKLLAEIIKNSMLV
jgi:predicted GIY-YIG superfamily endonuclease